MSKLGVEIIVCRASSRVRDREMGAVFVVEEAGAARSGMILRSLL